MQEKKNNFIMLIFIYITLFLTRFKLTSFIKIEGKPISLVLVLIFFITLIFFIFNFKFNKFRNKTSLVTILLIISVGIGFLKSINLPQTFYGVMMALCPFFAFNYQNNDNSKRFKFIKIIIFINIFYSLLIIYSSLNYINIMKALGNDSTNFVNIFQHRTRTMLGSSIATSIYQNLSLVMILYSIKENILQNKYWGTISLVLNIFSTLFLLSRLPFIVMIIVLLFYLKDKLFQFNKKNLLLYLILFVISLFIIKIMKIDLSRLYSGFNDESIRLRFSSLLFGLSIFKDNLLFGSGIGNIYKRIYVEKYITYKGVSGLIDPHNLYVFLLSELGIIGVSALCIFLVKKIKEKSPLNKFSILLIAVMLLNSLGGSHLINNPNIAYIFWFYLAILLENKERRKKISNKELGDTMKAKKALVISVFPLEYNTSATIQNKGIIRGLYENGYKVDVISQKPEIDFVRYDNNMNDIDYMINNSHYFDVSNFYKRFMSVKSSSSDRAKESARQNSFGKIAKAKIRKFIIGLIVYDTQIFNLSNTKIKELKKNININKYDVVISTSDPKTSHYIAGKLLVNSDTKWVQYWGDPMYHDITRTNRWNNLLVKRIERKILKDANVVVYASPVTLELQKELFPMYSTKMTFASQVSNSSEITVNTHIKDNYSISYVGASYTSYRNILPFYEWARSQDKPVIIAGPSDVELESTNNVTIYNLINYEQSVKIEENSEILICLTNIKGTQIPGKIYYLSSYNKPIIVILDGDYNSEIKTYLNSFNRFILCENNPESIEIAVEKAVKQIEEKTIYSLDEKLTPRYFGKQLLNIK